jgi:hypothetical protein
MKTLIIEGELLFTNFDEAVKYAEFEYGYEGLAWDLVVGTIDLQEVCDFLIDDGIQAEIENE